MRKLNYDEWDHWLQQYPEAHLLQTSAWGKFKDNFGWSSARVVEGDAGAQILFRSLPFGFTIAYIPKGPIGLINDNFWSNIDPLVRKKRSIFLKFEPDMWEESNDEIVKGFHNFYPSKNIQPRRTIVIDLHGDEEDWLKNMKPKTRYNIRLSQKKEIVVEESDDIDIFYDLMVSTGNRDVFGIHSKEYYKSVYESFSNDRKIALFIAYYQNEPLAGLMVFRSGGRAWYFYGASNEKERNRMPTYLLQFEAMKWAKRYGCLEYDLWGIPDEDEQELEENFSSRSDGLWGVYRFKRGFGGIVKRQFCAFDRVYKPLLYKLYLRYQAISGTS
jgi:lipid II:glycine glycyltransferase (peptidoglycan interpeptide bridge formation enzyme)